MRKTIVATVAVALVMTTGLAGCKTAPKMPWSTTAATADVETSSLAHSAPALPADVAKEAEGLAASTPSIQMTAPAVTTAPTTAGATTPYSAAPAFSATPSTVASNAAVAPQAKPTTAASYPTTGASPYSATPPPAASSYVATTPTRHSNSPASDNAADLGSFARPYNPNVVPPAKTVAQADPVTAPTTTSDRYGMSTAATAPPATNAGSVPPVTTAAFPAQAPGGDRYGNYQPKISEPPASPGLPANVNLASASSAASTEQQSPPSAYEAPASPATAVSATSGAGDRYAVAASVTPAPPSVTTAAPVNSTYPVTTPTAGVASASTYRPGGTSSYEGSAGSQPAVEIASRPKPVEQQQVPNVSAPGTSSEPSEASRYR